MDTLSESTSLYYYNILVSTVLTMVMTTAKLSAICNLKLIKSH